jgi:hypothetical protein
MFRFLAVLSVSAAFLALGSAAQVTKAPPVYFPTTKGAKLVYRYAVNVNIGPGPGGGGNRNEVYESEVREVVTAVEKRDAGTVVTLTREEEERGVTGTDTFLISDKGLFTTGTSVADPKRSWKIAPPACLLKLPFKEGNKWEYNCPAQAGGLVGIQATNTVHGPEEVVVPAGKYRALRVEHKGTSNGKPTAATFWYAPGVGLVKMETEEVVQELQSFTPGK